MENRLWKTIEEKDIPSLVRLLTEIRNAEMFFKMAPVPSRVQARGLDKETPPPLIEKDWDLILESRKEMKEREQRIRDDHPDLLLQRKEITCYGLEYLLEGL